MDFKELEYFSTIVKCGNLTHAARQLYVSQPTLSKFLQKLEEDLGLVLFQRGSRRLKLTYAGQRYYAHVERILSQKREMDAEMTDILRSDRGVLYVGIPPFRCSFSLPKVLPIFHKEFPQVQFRIVEAPSAVLDQKLLNGEIDLAFYMSFERITGLSYQVMHSDKMYAARTVYPSGAGKAAYSARRDFREQQYSCCGCIGCKRLWNWIFERRTVGTSGT